MKTRYILLAIAGMSACLSACKKDNQLQSKDNQLQSVNNPSILGKWNEVKYYVSQTVNGKIIDTTINAASLSTNDYAQFNNDYTVNIFQSADNPPPGAASPDYIINSTYNYSISGSVATLSYLGWHSDPIVLTGDTLITNRIVTMTDANNIVMHITIYDGPINATPKNPSYISDTYFTKAH